MPINSTTRVVSAPEIDLALDVEIDDPHDTVGAQQRGDGINDGVKLGNHGKRVAHGNELGTAGISILVEVADDLALQDHFLALVILGLVFVEAESTGVLADDFDV